MTLQWIAALTAAWPSRVLLASSPSEYQILERMQLLIIDPSLATSPILDVSVGHDSELIKVFRNSLINRSPYFDSQLARGVKALAFPNVEPETFRAFVEWLYDRPVETPTTTIGIQDYIILNKFARTVSVDKLANQTMDEIRSYCLSHMVSTELVIFLYNHTSNIKLRVLFCLELVLQARDNYSRMGSLTNASLTCLLERRGKFAVDFTNLMALCTKSRITWTPGRTFQKEFNCLFHTHLHSAKCDVTIAPRNQFAATKIREAFQCLER